MVSFEGYEYGGFYDEMFAPDGQPREGYLIFKEKIEALESERLALLQDSTARAQTSIGMTFNVYSDNQGVERILHLDLIPRIITGNEWDKLELGLKQRITALNLFIDDIYNDKKILRDKVIPAELIYSSSGYLSVCEGLKPPLGIWCHITGTDLVRGDDGNHYILEDNLRCPSGVSYLLENREILKRTFPDIFQKLKVRPVYDYTLNLRKLLEEMSPIHPATVAVLTPGMFNSAYFEHSYLAQQMGVELVEGHDLIVRNHIVYMRTTKGFERVSAIYRRIDDIFLDPLAFRSDSLLGVPGLFEAYRRGNVALVNAPGTGVADDKAVYAYVPDIIKYYLGEEAILQNVPTYICSRPADLSYVLENAYKLVVKQTDASGGYGMLIGPSASTEEVENFKLRIKSKPHNYIAQPVVNLSRVPTITENGFEGRHVDLRPYILYGSEIKISPGGLSRVALRKGSLVVNSSQGGGSKDTWVLYE